MKLALNDDRKLREFEIGDNVLARDYRAKGKWLPGSIVSRQGQVMYKVDVGNGIILKRHIDQLKRSLARDYRAKGKWLPGSIVSRQGQVMY